MVQNNFILIFVSIYLFVCCDKKDKYHKDRKVEVFEEIVVKSKLKGAFIARIYNLNDSTLIAINKINSGLILKQKRFSNFHDFDSCFIFIQDSFHNFEYDSLRFFEIINKLIYNEIIEKNNSSTFNPRIFTFIVKNNLLYQDTTCKYGENYLNYLPMPKKVDDVNFFIPKIDVIEE